METTTKSEYIGKATSDQIAVWKNKHGNVFAFEQADKKDENKVHLTYVKKPSLPQVQNAFRFLNEDPIKSGLMLLSDCRLGGSEVTVNDDEYKLGIANKMIGLFKPVVADLKEV
jgi:hypothetical protein